MNVLRNTMYLPLVAAMVTIVHFSKKKVDSCGFANHRFN